MGALERIGKSQKAMAEMYETRARLSVLSVAPDRRDLSLMRKAIKFFNSEQFWVTDDKPRRFVNLFSWGGTFGRGEVSWAVQVSFDGKLSDHEIGEIEGYLRGVAALLKAQGER